MFWNTSRQTIYCTRRMRFFGEVAEVPARALVVEQIEKRRLCLPLHRGSARREPRKSVGPIRRRGGRGRFPYRGDGWRRRRL